MRSTEMTMSDPCTQCIRLRAKIAMDDGDIRKLAKALSYNYERRPYAIPSLLRQLDVASGRKARTVEMAEDHLKEPH